MQNIRLLDIDDLIIMTDLLNVKRLKDISSKLGLTPPALSHRLRKYKDCLPNFVVLRKGMNLSLSKEAREYCVKAKTALELLTI